ncbi:GNAT family N-acetyltransferase [Mucilaginibacter gynuensis]|uniref:GNAT family N-acetyltransferase n=1 Tax=Mucilaginibacter gynuensis TaxID=1302236 RepID=A0ABP8HFW1_9SPHI
MLIRQATLNDIQPIMQLVAEVVPAMRAAGNLQWDNTYPNAAVFENDIQLGQLWVADVDGQIGGVTAITNSPEPDYGAAGIDINIPAVTTHRLAVNTRFRGLGIAAALLQQAEVVAADKGIKLALVDTNTENEATNKLFPKLGYTLAGKITLPHKPGLLFYCYQKQL